MKCERLISIIIPVYNEGPHILGNLRIVRDILDKAAITHELVLVDDGSKDNSWSEICLAQKELGNIRAFRFSRNFGKEAALVAGIDMAKGDACIIMDADLQHPPKLIPEMVDLWLLHGWQVVEAVKTSRGREGIFSRLSATFFYNAMNRMTGIRMQNASDFKLLDRMVMDTLRSMPEKETFFRGLSAWVGFRRISIDFEVAERTSGQSKWSFRSLLRLAIIAITSFSSAPLHFVTVMGTLFFIGSVFLGIQTLVNKLSGMAVDGFTTVILLILVTGSVLMISLGLIGTYIARIFNEVKGRPRYIISDYLTMDNDKDRKGSDKG
jgi:glycosyltransferase involved in cell wall biosynthesis